MKIASFKRIQKENFPPEDHKIIESIGSSLNPLADDLQNILNKNLSVDDNLRMEYKEIDLSVNASGIPLVPTQLKTVISGRIRGATVIKAENQVNLNSFVTSAPFVTFSQNDKLLTVNHVTGLPASTRFKLTLLLLG